MKLIFGETRLLFVCRCNVIACNFEISNSDSLARNNVSSFRKKFLEADILLYQTRLKKVKIDLVPSLPLKYTLSSTIESQFPLMAYQNPPGQNPLYKLRSS